jgi:hypothetical protein
MKKLFFITLLLLVIVAENSSAQMGHGMMRSGDMMGKEHMMDQKEMTDRGHMMQHNKMMGDMMGMSQDIAIMMRQMSVVMGNITDVESKMSQGRMQNMSRLMRAIAVEMNVISDIMGKGSATDEEISALQNRMAELQKQVGELRR